MQGIAMDCSAMMTLFMLHPLLILFVFSMLSDACGSPGSLFA